METATTKDLKKINKRARLGIIVFMIPHIVFEAFFAIEISIIALPLLFNFFISMFIINRRISNGKHHNRPFIAGFVVSIIVFSIRLLLGTIILNFIF